MNTNGSMENVFLRRWNELIREVTIRISEHANDDEEGDCRQCV